MVRAALYSSSFYPKEGGAERQMRQVLSCLAERGVSSLVFTEAQPGQSKREVINNLTINRSPGAARSPVVRKFLFLADATRSGLRRPRPDVVLSTQLGAATTAAAATARALRIPHIVRLTGGGRDSGLSEPVVRASHAWDRRRIGWLLDREATVIVSPAEHLISDMHRCFPWSRNRSVLVPNGVRLPEAMPTKDLDVVWYGRTGAVREADFLRRVASAAGHLSFSAIGHAAIDDPPSNLKRWGWVEDPEYLIARHRVAFLTSPTEGMPNFGLQALALGACVVAVDNLGTRELQAYGPRLVDLFPNGDLGTALARLNERARSTPVVPSTLVATYDQTCDTWFSLLQRVTGTSGPAGAGHR